MPKFHARYPDIQLDIGVSDRPVDLIADNVDCVLRGGNLSDQSLVARRSGMFSFVTCANPAYLEQHGVPQHPSELENGHKLVQYFFAGNGRLSPLDFNRAGERIEIKGHYAVAVNDSNAYFTAALAGLGISQPARFLAKPYLERGELVEILTDWSVDPVPMYVVYPPNRHLSAKLRVFVDWVAELFAELPGI
jgi:DNA-binding transcriptional LysR family regulator